MKEKTKSKLSWTQTLKYTLIVKYYEHIFPLFSNELEKERMQVLASMTEVRDTKHWKKYQRALKTLKFGYEQPLNGATVTKNADGSITTVTKSANGVTTEITTNGTSFKIEKGACPQGPVTPVPEVQATIEALETEMKNPQPWTGETSPEKAFPLNLTDQIINESK